MDNGQLDKQLLLNIVEVLFKMSALFKSADNISLIVNIIFLIFV